MQISNKNSTVVIKKIGNPTSFVFHSVIKLKYDPQEEERASLTKAKITSGGVSVRVSLGKLVLGAHFESERLSRRSNPRGSEFP
ncbi:hypothetical protein AVEN_254648-1 [Araneus ventricosus]|uniref:Uncharacterized protein n=1 Tax=Araneus ventricosus TaxID=182803 RepID=A0A4Y2LS23_ARAVE|nr:hypothetical protein AVEN_254648-1 [Araneus ventricosus]